MKHLSWLLILFIAHQAFAQEGSEKAEKALNHLYNYEAASHLKKLPNGAIDPAWESMFKDCFTTGNVIFDIPKKEPQNTNPYFLKYVNLSRYIELVRDIYFQHPDVEEIQYEFIILGNAISAPDSGTIVFEVEKRFANTSWSAADKQQYLFEIQFVNGEPGIASVRLSERDFTRSKVDLFFDQHVKNDDVSKELYTRIKIDYEEDVYDKLITAHTDSTGRLSLGQVGTRAKIIVQEVHGLNNEQFTLPSEWKTTGKVVSSQPAGGFLIDTRPYRWSGWNLTFRIGAGPVMQSEVNTANFTADTKFDSNPGYDFGGGFTITRFFWPDNWRRQKHNWIPGIGTGVSFHYTRTHVKSSQFIQNPYPWNDRAGDASEVLISGTNYEEILGTAIIKIPLYGELRKKVKNSLLGFKSFSLQAGANFMIPFLSRFKYEGIFSRHGRYQLFNNQVITDDSFYNYYTDLDREEDGVVDYENFMVEGMIRLNGFIPLSDQYPNHSMVIGLEFSTPFSRSTSRKTSDYQINSGDDEVTSTAFAKEKLYEYYFGISIGLNFINYLPD